LTLAFLVSANLYYLGRSSVPEQTADPIPQIGNCQKETLGLVKPDNVDLGVMSNLLSYCYSHIVGQGALDEIAIRRSKFLKQNHEDEVLLWMVVSLTLSGVILAGLQLIASYKLALIGKAEFAQSGEMSLERSKISVKSSVTGLLILTISFAFFMVYIIWVYTIKEQKIVSPLANSPTAQNTTTSDTSPTPPSSQGGLGTRPNAKSSSGENHK
jgi:hypothetical protein